MENILYHAINCHMSAITLMASTIWLRRTSLFLTRFIAEARRALMTVRLEVRVEVVSDELSEL